MIDSTVPTCIYLYIICYVRSEDKGEIFTVQSRSTLQVYCWSGNRVSSIHIRQNGRLQNREALVTRNMPTD